MNTINHFLKNPILQEQEVLDIDSQGLSELNSMFKGDIALPSHLKLLPKVKQNQIWTIKNDYLDYEGKRQRLFTPMMVLLTCDVEGLDEDTLFVRGCPISPFVEMASDKEQICDDSSITGFPFLIEAWNEQPMLIDILESYVGDYYADVREIETVFNEEQLQFREIEISKARYLNHSILAYTNEMERSENFSFSAILSFADYVKTKRMPLLHVFAPKLIDLPFGEEYALAAKTGNVLTDNDCIDFYTDDLPFKVEIRKKTMGFVLTIIPRIEVCLKNDRDEEFNYSSNSERIVYDNLKRGLYIITSPLINDSITIRLK